MLVTKETQQIKETISEAYKLDKALIEKWLNFAGTGLENCIETETNILKELPTFKMFKVEEDNKFIGYFGHEADGIWMSTIFIVPEHRPRKKEFWEEVKSKMKPIFYCGIHIKNKPAYNFYNKFGKNIGPFDTPDGPASLFEFKKD